MVKKRTSTTKDLVWRIFSRRNCIFFLLISLPIFIYCLPLLFTGNNLAAGDADYLMQTEEAMRLSILKYGQFPWWNPWVSGGVPLFANPQFGLLSVPTVFSLFFGSIFGYKLALSFYLLLGFWGIYLLLRKTLHTPWVTAALLGYIWTFGSFFSERIAGHYTFFTIQFFPFMLLFFLNRRQYKHAWIWLGISIGMMINAAAHNTSIMSLAVFGLFILFELVSTSVKLTKKHLAKITATLDLSQLKFLLLSLFVTLLVSGPRLFYSLAYFREYPRDLFTGEETIGIGKALFAIFGPIRQYYNQPSIPNWTWMEVSAYIGISTAVVALLCFVLLFKSKELTKARIGNISPLHIIIAGTIFFLLGLGLFIGKLSPYALLSHLPVFSGMRVAERWLVWTSLMTILFIGSYRGSGYRTLINTLLLISVVELFVFGSPIMAKPYTIKPAHYQSSGIINQQIHFDTKRFGIPYDENLTATTFSNIGQVIAGDSLIDTRNSPPFGMNTQRCDSDEDGCGFVLSSNATVLEWSPNRLKIQRTGTGDIILNMNPGKYWLVNNKYIFSHMRTSEPDEAFVIEDINLVVDIKLQPKYSPGWVIWKIMTQ